MKIRVGMVTHGFFDVPYWGAQERGWFAEEGLDVEFNVMGGIDAETEALLGGDIQIGIGSTEHVIQNVEQGGPLRLLGGNINRLTHSLIVQPDITRLEDLRGRTIGVSAHSAGTSSVFFDILEKVGLVYPGDYAIVEAGAVPPRHALLLDGTIDAAMQTDPHNYMAEDAGLGNLGPVTDWVPEFQFASVNCREDWAETHDEALQAFLRVAIRGSRWMYADQKGAVDVAERFMGIPTRYLERAWEDNLQLQAIPEDLRLLRAGIEVCIDLMTRDRTGQVSIADGATPERYALVEPLERAQKDLGLPVVSLA